MCEWAMILARPKNYDFRLFQNCLVLLIIALLKGEFYTFQLLRQMQATLDMAMDHLASVTEAAMLLSNTSLPPDTNGTTAPVDKDCTGVVLNAVIPIVCVLVFIGTVIVTYFFDDPGLRKLKRSAEKVEANAVLENDRNYIRYMTEHHMADHVKGHTFSSFSPSYATYGAPPESDRSQTRRRACSESHTGRRLSDASSETQVILEHMLLTIGSGSTYTSLRNRAFHVPFIHRRNKDENKSATELPNRTTKTDETGEYSEKNEVKDVIQNTEL
ncbi:hypothetical protein D915_007332 [Fasciola hepatica]|uniref:Uncharacterized protein n=1 Tax=Fasciola hepatica TaxID=6192 RepID=A0A4E0RYS9_FASHE|nr:hypothetical protein D915_007332 [Fasciola hepatica]